MKRSNKIITVALSLGLGIVSLTGCSSQTTNISASTKFYNDAFAVQDIIQKNLQSNSSYTDDQMKKINTFVNGYANLPATTTEFKSYMEVVKEVEEFTDDNTNSAETSTQTTHPTIDYSKIHTITPTNPADNTVNIGDPSQKVSQLMGEPDNKTVTTDKYGTSELWIYGTEYIFFVDGVVESISK